jgi:teichuronic acid biosynthesis glycosyltransferase TuaG
MPAYNAERTIGESIQSVLAQTYTDWELIVIAEDEASAAVAGKYRDGRIKVLRNETWSGAAKSRNRGIGESDGKWLAFLDADDLWRSDKLTKQLALGADISFTASAFIGYEYIMRAPERLSYKELLRRNLMSCSSVMARREVMRPFPEVDYPIHEDYVTWLKILRETDAIGWDEPLLRYRISRDSKSGDRLRSARMTYNAYRYLGYSKTRSAVMTARYAIHSIRKRILIKRSER